MKKWILFILCFVSFNAELFSCGYYPFGDDIRFSLLKPSYVPVYGVREFQYSFSSYPLFETDFSAEAIAKQDENTQSWYAFFEGKFPHVEIYNFIYGKSGKSKFAEAMSSSANKDVYEYITFAQKIAYLNSMESDAWEREGNADKKTRKKQIKAALSKASASKNEKLKKRYAYLAIRLAFYNNEEASIKDIFKSYFENQAEKDAVYYWALHFNLYTMPSSARKNVEIAKVFMHSQEKRFAVELMYDREISKEDVVKECKDQDEKYSVIFYYASKKLDRSINDLKLFSRYTQDEENLLLFLILRETNKLEDWILTPYYAEFSPMTSTDSWDDSVYLQLRGRIYQDRAYAKELAEWTESISFKDEGRSAWLKTLRAYLYFLAEDKAQYKNYTAHLKAGSKDEGLNRFNAMLLTLMQLNESASPNLSDSEIQKIILSEHKQGNYRFLFAVGRELEYKKNLNDAAYIYSRLNQGDNWEQYVFWRTKKLHQTLFDDYYTDYFFYLDAAYSPNEITELIRDSRKDSGSEFDRWKKEIVKADESRLYDLIGTKHLRMNKLSLALSAFENVNDSIWTSKNYHYVEYLDANPFYADFYSEHNKTPGDTVRFTKIEITRKLIDLLDKVERTPEGNKKAYYYFQIANCYFNMTQYGNSWMMKRYFWTTNATRTKLEDDSEYFHCNYAKRYYMMAAKATKDEKVMAFAYRMAGKCESYKVIENMRDEAYDENYFKKLAENNRYYKKLKEDYPDQYEPLMSNCQTFFEYNRLLQ